MLRATVSLSSDRCFPGQELGLALDLRLEPGWHVYGKPLPGNYQALELTFTSPLIDEQALELPAPRPVLLEALGETLPVYASGFTAHGKLGIKWTPPMPAPFMKGEKMDPGPYEIKGTLRFQACSDTVCEAAAGDGIHLPLTIEAGFRLCQRPSPSAKL